MAKAVTIPPRLVAADHAPVPLFLGHGFELLFKEFEPLRVVVDALQGITRRLYPVDKHPKIAQNWEYSRKFLGTKKSGIVSKSPFSQFWIKVEQPVWTLKVP